jgi:hypothetical protein
MTGDSLQTSFWLMVMLQTIGSIDMPGRGARKMPAPRQYVAILTAWLVLQLIAGISAGAERAAAAVGWALVLTGAVAGPFGSRAVNFMSTIATQFAPSTSATGEAVSTAAALGGTPGNTAGVSPLTPNPPTQLPQSPQ